MQHLSVSETKYTLISEKLPYILLRHSLPMSFGMGLSWNLELSGRQQALQTPLAMDSHHPQHGGYRVPAAQPQPHTQLCAEVWPELGSLGLHARCSSVLLHPPSAPPAAVPDVTPVLSSWCKQSVDEMS